MDIVSRNCNGDGIWEEPNYIQCSTHYCEEPNYSQCISTKHYCRENVDRFNTKWSMKKPKTQVTLFCTGEYVGNVSRHCNGIRIWDRPNYRQCISISIQYLQEQTARLVSGGSEYNRVTIILEDLQNITRDHTGLRSGDLLASSGKNHQTWEELKDEGSSGATSLVNAETEYNKAFNQVIDGEFSVVVVKNNVVMEVGKNSLDEITVPDRLKTSDSWIADSATEIKLKTNICSSKRIHTNCSIARYKYLEVQSFGGSYDVNSIIADFTITGRSCLNFSLIIIFGHLLGNFSGPFCGFWNFTALNTLNGAWSSFGSRVMNSTDSYTICEYNHTTNFAVLMSPGLTICQK
ncbi:unnamed protein product [Mytilus coruscus]|uniref:Uncharacterized protein n=1 Tax=Mytilus coruscus TaxID=42192 RepID=A0A6J8CWK2_MYTCO|nr:unnamed protein product [Mytilus coruscus]